MHHYLGVDIGTFESKGVLVDGAGRIVASAARPHRMIVPQPGWAEHRAREDWWGDFTYLSRKLLDESGVAPSTIRAVGCSRSEEHTSELQSRQYLVCRLLLEKKNN